MERKNKKEGTIYSIWVFLRILAHLVKNPPAKQETPVRFLGQEDPLEKKMATHSSIRILEYSMDRVAWQATVHGVSKSRTWLSNFHFQACQSDF